jgi:hypothetical protein
MRVTKKRVSPFVAVLPMMVFVACPQNAIRTSNPPEPTITPKPLEPATKMTNPPEPIIDVDARPPIHVNPPPLDPKLLAPKPLAAFSKREKKADGKCYVEVFANPPFAREVSCSAPIEPAAAGETWCKVEDAKDSSKRALVDCASK